MTRLLHEIAEDVKQVADSFVNKGECNCAAIDIGVGIQHEPMCGWPNPEEAAHELCALAAEIREAGKAYQHHNNEIIDLAEQSESRILQQAAERAARLLADVDGSCEVTEDMLRSAILGKRE